MDPSGLVVIAGIFVVLSFVIVTVILRHYELGVGVWPILAAVAIFLTLHAYFQYILHQTITAQLFILVAMLLFFVAALIKFWDIMGYTRRFIT